MQKINTFDAGRSHSLGDGYLPSQWIILGSGNSSDVFPFLLREVAVRISHQAGFFSQGRQYRNMMLLESCLQVTFLSQFMVVSPRNTALGLINLGDMVLESAFEMHWSSTNSDSLQDRL